MWKHAFMSIFVVGHQRIILTRVLPIGYNIENFASLLSEPQYFAYIYIFLFIPGHIFSCCLLRYAYIIDLVIRWLMPLLGKGFRWFLSHPPDVTFVCVAFTTFCHAVFMGRCWSQKWWTLTWGSCELIPPHKFLCWRNTELLSGASSTAWCVVLRAVDRRTLHSSHIQ